MSDTDQFPRPVPLSALAVGAALEATSTHRLQIRVLTDDQFADLRALLTGWGVDIVASSRLRRQFMVRRIPANVRAELHRRGALAELVRRETPFF